MNLKERYSFGLIVNPLARKVKHYYLPRRRFWEKLLPAAQVRVTENLAALADAVRHFRSQGVNAIASLGGDGTLHRVLTAALNTYPPAEIPDFLPLCGGTMNGLPTALGLKADPSRLLAAALRASPADALEIRAKTVLRIEHRPDEDTPPRISYGFTFANGLLFRAFSSYYRRPEPGVWDALRVSLVPFTAGKDFFAPLNMEVHADGEPWLAGQVNVVLASTLDNPVLWFKPFGAELNGRPAFHCLVNAMPRHEIALHLWGIFRGSYQAPFHRLGQVKELEIRGREGYLIDGDLYPAAQPLTLKLSLGPSLRFLAFASH